MIKNKDELVLKNIPEAEKILRKLRDTAEKLEKDEKLTVHTIETLIGESISEFTKVVLNMSGELLSNIEVKKKR